MEKDIAPDESGTYQLAHYLTPEQNPSDVLLEVVEEVHEAGGGTIQVPPGEYSLPDPTVLEDVDLQGGLGRTVVVFDEPLRREHAEDVPGPDRSKGHLRLVRP